MAQAYSVNIEIDVSFVGDLNEDRIEHISNKLENAI